jgi:hypothetical protein
MGVLPHGAPPAIHLQQELGEQPARTGGRDAQERKRLLRGANLWQVGAVLCATDPVAVVALLRDLGASKKLSTVIEGESLFNDGTAIVVFKLFFELAKGATYSPIEIVVFFLQVQRPSPLD